MLFFFFSCICINVYVISDPNKWFIHLQNSHTINSLVIGLFGQFVCLGKLPFVVIALSHWEKYSETCLLRFLFLKGDGNDAAMPLILSFI